MKGLAVGTAILVGGIGTLLLLLDDHQARLPGIETARGRAWVLLAGQYEEAKKRETGQYVACVSEGSCLRALGWPLLLRRLPGKQAAIEASSTTFRVRLSGSWREGGAGAWVLEQGGDPYFESEAPDIPKKVLDSFTGVR